MKIASLGRRCRLGIATAVLLAAGGCGGKDEPSAASSPSSAAGAPAEPSISGRGNHNCVLAEPEPFTCWGYNIEGQLGIGTTKNSTVPVPVDGLDFGIRAFSAGEGPTCAVTTEGGVKCWGKNDSGQLGNDSTISSSTPVDVAGLSSGVTAVSAGVDHACALLEDGGIKCWGANKAGQLGDGTTDNSSVPVEVDGLGEDAVAIAVDFGSTCAITSGGGVKCWGSNTNGQLGNGTTDDSSEPVDVKGLDSGVAAIDANGRHACAVTEDGAVLCWGSNMVGQLGNGSTDDSDEPVEVSGLGSGVTAISTGSGHSCALTDAGAVTCWGFNEAGGLGNGSTKNADIPVAVDGLDSGVIAITTGNAHSCALTDSGIKCWGYNGYGGLGVGTTDNATRPVDVVLGKAVPAGPMGPAVPDEPSPSESPSADHAGH